MLACCFSQQYTAVANWAMIHVIGHNIHLSFISFLVWPWPTSVKEVQRFIGFSNFYQKFIRNFSSVAAPLTNLTKKVSGPFTWTAEAEKAFQDLKVRFTAAPILTLPDPSLPFVVEVDALDVAVGAVLSQ